MHCKAYRQGILPRESIGLMCVLSRSATGILPVEVGSLQGPGVPQEVAGLINALQHLGAMNRDRRGRGTGAGMAEEVPPEVQSAISMLRQLRDSTTAKEDSVHATKSEPQASQSEQTEEAEHPSHVQACPGCGQPLSCATKDDLHQLEARVREHMDRALDRLQSHFDSQIDKLTHAMDSIVQKP